MTSAPYDGSELREAPGELLDQPRATLLGNEQARIAAMALARRHRLLQAVRVPLAHRLMQYQTMHYELRPEPA